MKYTGEIKYPTFSQQYTQFNWNLLNHIMPYMDVEKM